MSKLMELVGDLGEAMTAAEWCRGYELKEAQERNLKAAEVLLSEIRAAAAELERDAARYRWLRNGASFPALSVCTDLDAIDVGASGVAGTYEEAIGEAVLDEAIDAAMEAANGSAA